MPAVPPRSKGSTGGECVPCAPLQQTSIGRLAFWLIFAEARKTRRAQPGIIHIKPISAIPLVKRFAPDEAVMLACCVPGLMQFSQQEFEAIWDDVINNTGKASVQVTNDQKRLVQGLHQVIKVANSVRQQYTAYQTNVGTQQMDFVFCLRTTTSVARRLTPDSKPREVIEEVVLPKASDAETRRNLEFLIANT
jgi:hypothetical protein